MLLLDQRAGLAGTRDEGHLGSKKTSVVYARVKNVDKLPEHDSVISEKTEGAAAYLEKLSPWQLLFQPEELCTALWDLNR